MDRNQPTKYNKLFYYISIFIIFYFALCLQSFVLSRVSYSIIKIDIFSLLTYCFIIEKNAPSAFFISLINALLISSMSSAPHEFFLILYFCIFCSYFLLKKFFLFKKPSEKYLFLIFSIFCQFYFYYLFSIGNNNITFIKFIKIYFLYILFNILYSFLIMNFFIFFESLFIDKTKSIQYNFKLR